MEKYLITLADQEISERIADRNHFLKDIDEFIGWKRINKILSNLRSEGSRWQEG